MSFWDVYTGFDIVAFDESIAPSLTGYVDGVSLREAIEKNYGLEAVTIIERLMKL